MRPIFAAAAICGILAASCGQSNVPNSSQVKIFGKVVGLDGNPVVGQKVSLIKELDLAQLLGGAFEGLVSVGVICATNNPPAICNSVKDTTTNTDGGYSFVLSGADTQGIVGQPLTFVVDVQLPPGSESEESGPDTQTSFVVQSQTMSVPEVSFWHPSLAFAASTLSWTGQRAGATYGADFVDKTGNPVWQVERAQSPLVVDARVLEDSHGLALVTTKTQQTVAGNTFDVTYLSQTLPYQSNAGPPMSRGAVCQLEPPASQVINAFTTAAVTPCTMTSGGLSGIPVPSTAPCAGIGCLQTLTSQAVIDLGSQTTVGSVVVRGCSSPCQVQLSPDASNWYYTQTTSTADQVLTFGSKRGIRYVGVGMQFPPEVWQISVWPPGSASNAAGMAVQYLSPSPTAAAVHQTPVHGAVDLNRSDLWWQGWAPLALLLVVVLLASLAVVMIWLIKKNNKLGQP